MKQFAPANIARRTAAQFIAEPIRSMKDNLQ